MRGFQNGITFWIWTSGSRDIHILVLQKRWFCGQDLKGNFILRIAQKTNFDIFCSFLRISLITSKISQFSKIKSYFMQNFIEFYRKYFSCGKEVAFEIWGLKTSFGSIGGPKDLHSHKSRNLDPIFSSKALFYAEC